MATVMQLASESAVPFTLVDERVVLYQFDVQRDSLGQRDAATVTRLSLFFQSFSSCLASFPLLPTILNGLEYRRFVPV